VIARFVGPPSASPKRDGLTLFCGMAIAPALGFYLYFLTYLSAEGARRAVGQEFFVPSGEVSKNVFYMRILGLDNPVYNIGRMLAIFVGMLIFVLGAATVDVFSRQTTRQIRLTAIVLGLVFLLALYLAFDLLPWLDIPRALPLTTSI